jgi:hypothetical protein
VDIGVGEKQTGQRSGIADLQVLTVSEEFPSLITNVSRQHNGDMSQVVEQLFEADVYVADHSLRSDIA